MELKHDDLEPWQHRYLTPADLPLPPLALAYGEHIDDPKED